MFRFLKRGAFRPPVLFRSGQGMEFIACSAVPVTWPLFPHTSYYDIRIAKLDR